MSVNNSASITCNGRFRQTNPQTIKKHLRLFKNTNTVDLHLREELIAFFPTVNFSLIFISDFKKLIKVELFL